MYIYKHTYTCTHTHMHSTHSTQSIARECIKIISRLQTCSVYVRSRASVFTICMHHDAHTMCATCERTHASHAMYARWRRLETTCAAASAMCNKKCTVVPAHICVYYTMMRYVVAIRYDAQKVQSNNAHNTCAHTHAHTRHNMHARLCNM